MAPTTDEQFQFLLSCIRHSNHGKIDFTKVAEECSIVTRGAAAKRHERLLKAHNINPNGGTADTTTTPTASPSPRKKTAGTKRNARVEDNDEAEPDESAKKAKMMKEKAVERAERLVAKNPRAGIKEDPELFVEQNVKVEGQDD